MSQQLIYYVYLFFIKQQFSFQISSLEHNIDEQFSNYHIYSNQEEPYDGYYCDVQLFAEIIHQQNNKQFTYIPIRKIGYGRFSTVYMAYFIERNLFACLKISRNIINQDQFQEEAEILQKMNQKDDINILKYYDSFTYYYIDKYQLKHQHFILVTQLLGHNLLKLVERYAPQISSTQAVPLQAVKHIIKQLLIQVSQIHKQNLIHTDLKLENIALTKYLPEITKNSCYDAYSLLFGCESYDLFTCKLSTPANIIDQQNINYLDSYSQDQLDRFEQILLQSSQNINQYDQYQQIFQNLNIQQQLQVFCQKYFNNENKMLELLHKNIFNMKEYIHFCSKIFNIIKMSQQQSNQLNLIDFTVENQKIKINNYNINIDKKKKVYDKQFLYQKNYQENLQNQNQIYFIAKQAFLNKDLLKQYLQQQNQQTQQLTTVDYRYFALDQQNNAYYPQMIKWFDKSLLIPYSDDIFDIKIIDFGNYFEKNQLKDQCVGTRTYRAPETILGCQLSEKIDIFAIGCIAFELITGNVLFGIQKSNDEYQRDYDQIQLMMQYLSNKEDWQTIFKEGNQEIIEIINGYGELQCKQLTQLSVILQKQYNFSQLESQRIEQFLLKLLCVDPNKRCSADEALQLDWLKNQAQSDSYFSNSGRIQLL